MKALPLEWLNVEGCDRISDFTPVQKLPLKYLNLMECTQVKDLRTFKDMPLLDLDLSLTGVTDVSPLRGMRLESLNLCGTKVADLSPLDGITTLRELVKPDGTRILYDRPAVVWKSPAQEVRPTPSGRPTERPAEATEDRTALMNSALQDVADTLLKLDFTTAGKRIDSADERLAGSAAWQTEREIATKVAALPEVLLASFESDIGQDTQVYLKQGSETLRIRLVSGGEVVAEQRIRSGGRVVASAERRFSLDDLDVREKLKRLGSDKTPDRQIMRGLLAWELKRSDTAGEFFDESGCFLGTALANGIGAMQEQQRAVAQERSSAALEAAASRAWPGVLLAAGVSPNTQDLRLAIRKKVYTEDQVEKIRKQQAFFREKYGETEFAKQQEETLLVLDRVTPGISLYVDQAMIEAVRKQLDEDNGVQIKGAFSISEDGLLACLSSNPKLTNLSALKGLPIVELNLSDCKVKTLEPLRHMPIRKLVLSNCGLADISPLKGMPITELNLKWNSDIRDLEPLAGMPIRTFDVAYTRVRTLAPLKGMPLETLLMHAVSGEFDIWPLKGAPLKHLDLSGPKVRDLSPLEGAPLEYLSLTSNSLVSDLRPLAKMPLAYLDCYGCDKIVDIAPLRGMPLKELFFGECKRIEDFSPLKGLPLTALNLNGCIKMRDLTLFRGMPLTSLHIEGCREIRDLSPLKGMPLQYLYLNGLPLVKSLEPLAKMRLRDLSIEQCTGITDLTPVKNMPLSKLFIQGSGVKDLSPVKHLREGVVQ